MQSTLNTFRHNFSPLRNRNFSLYLGGQAVSLIGTWLQMTAQSIVVYQLSKGSATALGVVSMLGTLPILLLSPWTGVWADRLDRRRLLLATQIGAMVLAFVLAVLVQTGSAQLWHVYVLSALLGILTAIDFPAQQAFLGDLSGIAEVRKAVNLNATVLQVSRMLGPALAGYIIGALGAALAFWLNGLSFVAVIISLLLVRSGQVRSAKTGAADGGLGAALDFIRSQPRILDLILFVVILAFFGLSALTIVPAFVRGDAVSTGYMLAASGLGALVSTLFIVPLAQAHRRTGLVVGGAVLWMGLWFVVISFAQQILPLAIAGMFFGSLGPPVVMTTALGLTQVLAPPTMRARLLNVLVTVSFGFLPFSSLLVGYSADHLGVAEAMRINGVFMLLGAGLMLLRPALRRWEVAAPSSMPPAQPVEA